MPRSPGCPGCGCGARCAAWSQLQPSPCSIRSRDIMASCCASSLPAMPMVRVWSVMTPRLLTGRARIGKSSLQLVRVWPALTGRRLRSSRGGMLKIIPVALAEVRRGDKPAGERDVHDRHAGLQQQLACPGETQLQVVTGRYAPQVLLEQALQLAARDAGRPEPARRDSWVPRCWPPSATPLRSAWAGWCRGAGAAAPADGRAGRGCGRR